MHSATHDPAPACATVGWQPSVAAEPRPRVQGSSAIQRQHRRLPFDALARMARLSRACSEQRRHATHNAPMQRTTPSCDAHPASPTHNAARLRTDVPQREMGRQVDPQDHPRVQRAVGKMRSNRTRTEKLVASATVCNAKRNIPPRINGSSLRIFAAEGAGIASRLNQTLLNVKKNWRRHEKAKAHGGLGPSGKEPDCRLRGRCSQRPASPGPLATGGGIDGQGLVYPQLADDRQGQTHATAAIHLAGGHRRHAPRTRRPHQTKAKNRSLGAVGRSASFHQGAVRP